MTFIYPIKKGTENTPELLYSVRSVAKAYPDAQIVLLSERLPKWANGIQQMHFKETSSRGAQNVWLKLLQYCRANRNKDFILMNDDIFINKPYNIEGRYFFDGTLAERAKPIKAGNFYRMRIEATESLCMAMLGEANCYDIHQPFYLNSDIIVWMNQHLKMNDKHYLFKSIIGNMGVLPSVRAVHVKLDNPANIKEGMLYFSCDDMFMAKGGEDALAKLWPDKCRFEK